MDIASDPGNHTVMEKVSTEAVNNLKGATISFDKAVKLIERPRSRSRESDSDKLVINEDIHLDSDDGEAHRGF